ncbi:transcriptional regulator [Actinomadura fulvescens]|uniref:Transcriptional regulator n=1 Tax=Actinomadura fulvescens TaxID=46160 RepID=A0ABN3QP10_9ACTN
MESLVREDATIDAGELYTVAGMLGMTDQQVRLCVRRLVADERFIQEGRGRRALLRATDDMRRALEPDVEFVRLMYAQDQNQAPWDGVWHLVAFAVPETLRPARDALRDAIVHLGGAPLQGGLYVTANPWEDLVEAEAVRLQVTDHITFLTSADLRVGGVTAPRDLAARLWPLDELARGHDRLAALAADRWERLSSPEPLAQPELLAIAIELAAAFTTATEPDPLLPPELLPRPWPGAQARELVARCWAELLRRPTASPAPRLFRRYAAIVNEITAHLPATDDVRPTQGR